MKIPRIAEAIEKIDDDLIAESEEKNVQKGKNVWYKAGFVAACLCLVFVVIIIAGNGLNWFKPVEDNSVKKESASINMENSGDVDQYSANNNENGIEQKDNVEDYLIFNNVAYGFTLEGQDNLMFSPISFSDRKKYNLVPEDDIGLTPENTYVITEKDLGNVIGKVGDCENSAIIGKTVYHFASYPDSSICILDNDGKYEFYTYNYYIDLSGVKNSDEILTAYGLPDTCVQVEVCKPDLSRLFTITDIQTVKEICSLVSGCENIGREASEQLFANAWFEAYGNDDVYYNETYGVCVFRKDDTNELAHELWNKDEKCLYIVNNEGYSIFIDYFPSIRVFFFGDGQYSMTKESVDRLNELLDN